ncbi:MAG TPA: HAMP domain-containing sensor histidine kinase [Melioribacteraceae bacterium]|nr:HAMP domain-containing sensor histidine kinase [Melioribacteraceae bacterium]
MLRLHKQNTDSFEPFYKSLEDLDSENGKTGNIATVFKTTSESGQNVLVEKYSHLFQSLLSYSQELEDVKTIPDFVNVLKTAVRKLIPVKEAELLYFDDMLRRLNPPNNKPTETSEVINNYYNEGILTILFETRKPIMLPELKSLNSQGPKLNYIIFPLYELNVKKGVFVVLTGLSQNNFSEYDKHFINTILSLSISKVDKLILKNKLNNTYDELQTYQAKLSNDFRLSAIGELTEGIVEDIMNPLQVILSQAEMLHEETGNNDLLKIKNQVKKINNVISRLVKFSAVNQKNVSIQPCNLNNILNDYYELIRSTLENAGMELVLDLEEVLPPILTHQNYIYQIMTNIFGLIKKSNFSSGGILIQTRYKNDMVLIKLITTNRIEPFDELKNENGKMDLNIKIVKNLMNKHEGKLLIENLSDEGSIITCKFPLKRKVI